MSATRLNLAALVATLAVLLASAFFNADIEWRARGHAGPGDWNRLYLIAPSLHAVLAAVSIATLPACFRRRKVVEPIFAASLVLLITLAQIQRGLSKYDRYSTGPAVRMIDQGRSE